MKDQKRLRTQAMILYGVTVVLFLLFFLYIGFFENSSVYQTREDRGYNQVDDLSFASVEDETTPVGVRNVYTWTLEEVNHNEISLSFYLVHSYAEVYFDDELVYSLMASEHNRICKSISSNWITVPIYPEDTGKEVKVIATPIFKSVKDRPIEFYVGSKYAVFLACMRKDGTMLLLACICMLMGVFITVMQIYLRIRKTKMSLDMLYLGILSTLLGLWRITDQRSSAFLFSENPMLLGYVTIGSLCLCVAPFLLFMKERFRESNGTPILILSMIASGTALIILVCQVLGIADFRETLFLCHIAIIATMCLLLVTMVVRGLQHKGSFQKQYSAYAILLTAGAVLDLISFYKNGSSAEIIYTVIAFIIYVLILFSRSVIEMRTTAYTDSHTGLFNRTRWNELMEAEFPFTGPIGLLMLDLNGLKYINDTMGHNAGDRMIFHFANILRNTLPANSIICRWGGDEFTAMLTDVTEESMEKYVGAIRAAVEIYNHSGNTPQIHFAAGYAISTEYPELSKQKLLEIADAHMYQDKKEWYDRNLHRFR